MIVDRRTFIAKNGKQDELVEQIKKAAAYMPFAASYRIYTPQYGQFGVVVLELEFKDLAECDRYWAGWTEKAPQTWWETWFSLTENGGGSESFFLVSTG
jgi:hypothetical protein